MLLQTLCHPSFLRLPLGCWQTIKHPLYGKPCRVHFAFGGWERRNERTAARRKIQLPLQAQSEVCSRPKRNKWRGPAAGGEVAVYAGFGLEQTQRSARRVDLTTPTLAIKLSQEPKKELLVQAIKLVSKTLCRFYLIAEQWSIEQRWTLLLTHIFRHWLGGKWLGALPEGAQALLSG